jgi:voltage-gated potassium channel
MITGIAVLGLLAGSLASFFRLDNGKPSAGSPSAGEAEQASVTSSDAALQAVAAEVSALRHQVETLAARLTGALPGQGPQEPAGDEDAPR